MISFAEMMELSSHGPDTWIGTGPSYPWGGLFGGQIVAQALNAACRSVEPDRLPHSCHAYFIRRGDAVEPIRYEVDRVRDGRSFSTRSVTARQSGGVILHLTASLQRGQGTEPLQVAVAPPAPDPATMADDSWSPLFERRLVHDGPDGAIAWSRLAVDDPDDPVIAACALAFLSDDLATDVVHGRHHQSLPPGEARWMGTSLDHAIWFQAPITGGTWQLHHYRADGLLPPRGLAIGHVFGPEGAHLATVAQEVLLRPRPAAG